MTRPPTSRCPEPPLPVPELTRRAALRWTALAAAVGTLPGALTAADRIPQRLTARVIVDNDFAGDPDGLVALAHQLLMPRTRVSLITVTGLDPKLTAPGVVAGQTIGPGVAIARDLVTRLGQAAPSVAPGRELGTAPDASAAARAIVAEAMRDDPLPLFFTCGGPMTNLADALRLEPAIARRIKAIWIGGAGWPAGGWEYNLAADAAAARAVLEQSAIELWQVPQPAYRQMAVSVAEMEADFLAISPFTRWLYERFTSPPDFVDIPGVWPMGDSPLVLLSATSGESSSFATVTGRRIRDDLTYGEEIPGRMIRVYERLDLRLTWADFLARLRLHAAGR